MNQDYTSLLECAVLASVAIGLAGWERAEPGGRWRWLMLFAAFAAGIAGVEMASSNEYVAQLAAPLTAGLLAAAAVALAEFAGCRGTVFRPVLYLLAVVPTAAIAAGFHPQAWLVLVFATVTGTAAWAAFVLRRNHEPERPPSPSIMERAFVGFLPGYAATLALPSYWIEAADLDEVVRVARLGLGGLLALSVYAGYARRLQRDVPANAAAAWRRRHYRCAWVMTLLVVAGAWVAHLAGESRDAVMRRQILERTRLAAGSVEAALLETLRWDAADADQPGYLHLKALMISLREANPDLRFVLLAGIQDGRAAFLVDSEPPDSPDYSPPGQAYDEASPEYLAGMMARTAFVLGPVKDRWGTWVIGSVPVGREMDGRGIHLEIDVDATQWAAEIHRARLPVALVVLTLGGLIAGSFVAQERLRESSLRTALSEKRSNSLIEGSPDCVQMFDHAGRYLAVNQSGLRALGLAESAVLGRHFSELWPPAERPRIAAAVAQTLAGESVSLEADYLRPDGRTITWRVATNPVRDEDGRVCNFVAICVDLTTRKQTEDALRAAKDAAESATRAKSEFLSVMSHELRTPLAGVISVIDLLRDDPPQHQRERYTAVARDSAQTLLRILDDILDMSKIEAGKLSLETIAFRPRDEFKHLSDAARLSAEMKGLEFEYAVAGNVPETLIGDPTRWRQVLGNLQNNALKFTETGGVFVTITAQTIDERRVRLKLTVRDTGPGVDELTRQRLFRKFEQADASTTRRYGGTGLGLSIVKALADAMGGTVEVQGGIGQGSRFIFEAPVEFVVPKPQPVAAPAPAAVRRGSSVSLRILCAEDDAMNRIVAEALLSRFGHTVVFAENGQLAIDRLRQERFDLVLMDGRMPVLDGLKAAQLIRDPSTGVLDPQIYICAATANAFASDRQQCLDHGMNDYVSKPLQHASLSAALDKAIAHLRARGLCPPDTPAEISPGQPVGMSAEELLSVLKEDAPPAGPAAELPEGTLDVLLGLFAHDAPRRLATIRSAWANHDLREVSAAAHPLKSSARYVTAHRLSELAAALETQAESGNLGGIEPILVQAEAELADFLRRTRPVARP